MAEKKIKSATKRDPKLSAEENFAVSPFKVAYDVLGKEFLSMPEEARNFVMKMVMSGDLTATEIRKASKNLLPYNPDESVSSDTVLDDEAKLPIARQHTFPQDLERLQQNMDMRELENRLREQGRGYDSRSMNTMSDEEFYRTFFGYDYQQKQIPQTDAERDFFKFDPQYEDNLPKGPIEGNKMFKYQEAFYPDGRPMKAAEGGTMTKNTLTPEEYQARNIDFYAPFTIGVQQAPEVDEEEEEVEPIRPDILTPVGQRGEQVANVFGQIPIYGSGEQFGTEDYNSYIENFDKQQATDLSGKSFDRYLKQAAGVPGAVATVATGLPISALAYGAGQLARKEHRKNAAAIQASDGMAGDMFKFNGQTVSRAPGSKFFTGNLGGLSQGDLYRSREIAKGFIPGTMQERAGIVRGAGPQGMPGATGLGGVTSIEGAMMDAFGTVHTGQRDESGHMMASATQAQRLREQEFRDMASQANIDISNLKGADFVNAAVAFKQHVDGVMKTDPSYGGFLHKTSNLSQAANNSALDRRRSTAIDFLKDKYGITTVAEEPSAPPTPPPAQTIIPSTEADAKDPSFPSGSGDSGGDDDDGARQARESLERARDEARRDTGFSGGTEDRLGDVGGGAPRSDSGYGPGFRAMGGRVGMQAGGVAQQPQPAGFVGGPPENFTDGQTVADDQPMSVPEGTFVINAAAVEFAGSDDIKKMLSDAYGKMQKKVDKSIRVAKIPTEDEIDVAVSRGEVIVPPEVAKIIGYDRLEKINNRGKKEISRRQKAAEGGFLGAGGYAEGGDVGEDIPMEESIALNDSTRQKFSTFLKSRRQRGDVEKLIDSLDDRERLFVLGLVETTAAKDSVDSMMGVMQTAINRANTDRPSFRSVNDLSSVMKQRSSRGSGSRMFQYDGLEPSKITPRLREVVQGRVPNAVTKLFMAAENLTNPETEGQRPLPFDVMFYTKPDAPLAKDFEKNPKMRYHSSFGGHDYYALDAAPEN